MKREFRIYHREKELKSTGLVVDFRLAEKQWPGVPLVKVDSFMVLYGYDPSNSTGPQMPVTRRIEYKINGSKHKCDARCQNAPGNKCECSCEGKYHGINR